MLWFDTLNDIGSRQLGMAAPPKNLKTTVEKRMVCSVDALTVKKLVDCWLLIKR
jgi:hypothetical protein